MKQIMINQQETYKELGDLYGLFFEDINHAADGGLYAELVQNRSFEFCKVDRESYHPLMAWEKSEGIAWEVVDECPIHEDNPHYLIVDAQSGAWIQNTGFNAGIYVEAGKCYRFSVFARSEQDAKLQIAVVDADGKACTENAEVPLRNDEMQKTGDKARNQCWKKYEVELNAHTTTTNGRLRITFADQGAYELDMVSLFPKDTFKNRENGLRKDIAEALAQMKPKFMRFPGGCLTHDGSLNDHDRNSMYRWRRTIGRVEERPSWRNNWGYNQTLGLGYYEYFCFCEDIGAKPLPVLPGGFNPHKGEGVAIEQIGEWVQEALDLIEFANGDISTKWGAVRAEMGHEEPFHMEYLGIGNEEIGDGFFERYPYFHEAIRKKYPEIKIINTAGPFAVGEGYDAGWTSAKKYGSDLIDEHYYSSPEWFLANMHHYEDYDEHGPKVFLGEYASWGNTYYNAIVEAAYMTHLERSKAVALACYAPMLCNVDYVNWQPDMLWFDNHQIMKTPNYYVQKMFMTHQGTDAVSFETKGLDEVIKLIDKENIAGNLVIAGNDVTGRLYDIQITDNQTNKVTTVSEIDIVDNEEHVLHQIDSQAYTLEFSFRRSSGRKGLKIFFGKTEDSALLWEFGGWDNWDCNISSIVKGRGSTISHRIFHVEDKEYRLRLEVNGRTIKTWVNGVLYNDTTDRLPEIEELYITASVDRTNGKTYLKAVNLTGEAKEVEIMLYGETKTMAHITKLQDCQLSAVNKLGEKECVTPITCESKVTNNCLPFTFAPHSVTVMELA